MDISGKRSFVALCCMFFPQAGKKLHTAGHELRYEILRTLWQMCQPLDHRAVRNGLP